MSSSLKQRALGISAWLRPYAGTLVLLPLVGLFLPGDWSVELPTQAPATAVIRDPGATAKEARTVPLKRWPDGVYWERGQIFKPAERLIVDSTLDPGQVILQVQTDANDIYIVEAMTGAGKVTELWRSAPLNNVWGLTTRKSPGVSLPPDTHKLRVRAKGGDAAYAVSWVAVTPVFTFRLVHVAATLWLLFGFLSLLSACGPVKPVRAVGANLLAGWARVDTAAAVVLCFLNLFTASLITVVSGLILLLIWLAAVLLKRSFALTAVATLTSVGLYFLVITPVVKTVVRDRVERLQVLDLEHRLKPHGQPDINADGVRLMGEAKDLREQDFNIIFLGDSFTYGWSLEYEDTFTSRVEEIAASSQCEAKVRALNFGWPGASPIVAQRLLRQVGKRYKPDLVVYNLDMTDFRDDLLYEDALQREGWELEPDVPTLIWQATRYFLLGISDDRTRVDQLQAALRPVAAPMSSDRPTVPNERFFPLMYPLKETRARMERGTIKYLKQIRAFSEETLGVPMAMIIFPRACQYSKTEAPRNWEHDCPVLGEYVLEPNRYLAEIKDKLGFPMFDLLPDFKSTNQFPLYLEDDPHWNVAGAKHAARAAARYLMENKLIPCKPAAPTPAPTPAPAPAPTPAP